MVQHDSELIRATETRVREIFKAADYAVSEAVGERPGEVVFFAEEPQRAGRLRIHWVVWAQCPEDLDAALDALDQDRTRLGADRAMAVLARGSLPEGYCHDLGQRRVNAFTLRRFAFELLDVLDQLRKAARPPADAPHHPDQFLARRAITERGETVSAVDYIESVLDRDEPLFLLIEGERAVGRRTLLAHVASRRARACLADLDRVRPLLTHEWTARGAHVLSEDLAWSVETFTRRLDALAHVWPFSKLIILPDSRENAGDFVAQSRSVLRLRLLAADEQDIRDWYRTHLPEDVHARLDVAWAQSSDVVALARPLTSLSVVRMAAVHATKQSQTAREWLARFVMHYMRALVESPRQNRRYLATGQPTTEQLLAEAALEDFALGSSRRLNEVHQRRGNPHLQQWFEMRAGETGVGQFTNRLVRDYFLARKIADEVRLHGPDIFARYQFPEEHVLLFLAVIAPEIAAMATADRSAELRAHLQEEIEHQLQLTLAHPLKRSVGALRTHLGRLRRALPDTLRTQYAQELARMDDELGFLAAMAENTRRWHEVPDEPREEIPLEQAAESALSQLRDSYDGVHTALTIPANAIVRAGRHTLQEILHCLLENAFHAARDPHATQPPRVEVRAALEGSEVMRIEVLDSGPGVDPADRERIFEPRVTTKKGGPGRPLGTGMGLAIARKYAHAIGGRIEIDPAQPQTCFVLKLVAGGMHRG